jgi:NADPH:quinone reductase-like Zn-dependent oxidoreductase
MTSTPTTMRAVQLRAYDGKAESIAVAELPMPRPGPGQVLVRVAASPINPSDLMFIRGLYGFKKPLPAVPGFEGSGTVVEAGGGILARFLKGRRVACHAADPNIPGGMWAEYVVTSARSCVPLSRRVEMEQGATMLVNPLTAWALMDEARSGRHKAVVQTAAASALGRMVVRLGQKFSIPVVNVVRRPAQVDVLREMGAEHVLNSGDPGFDASLRDLCHRLGATMGFDAVAGEMSARVLRAQPPGSRLLVYGALSLGASQADPGSLIFEGKRLEGFWVSAWLRRRSLLGQLRITSRVQELLAQELKTELRARLPLEEVAHALEQYAGNMTGGKVLLVP